MNPSRRTHIQSYGYYQSKYNTQQQRKKRAMETSADFQNEHFLIGETQPSFSLTNVIHSIYVAQFQICSSTHSVRYTHTTIYNYCIAKFSLSSLIENAINCQVWQFVLLPMFWLVVNCLCWVLCCQRHRRHCRHRHRRHTSSSSSTVFLFILFISYGNVWHRYCVCFCVTRSQSKSTLLLFCMINSRLMLFSFHCWKTNIFRIRENMLHYWNGYTSINALYALLCIINWRVNRLLPNLDWRKSLWNILPSISGGIATNTETMSCCCCWCCCYFFFRN